MQASLGSSNKENCTMQLPYLSGIGNQTGSVPGHMEQWCQEFMQLYNLQVKINLFPFFHRNKKKWILTINLYYK